MLENEIQKLENTLRNYESNIKQMIENKMKELKQLMMDKSENNNKNKNKNNKNKIMLLNIEQSNIDTYNVSDAETSSFEENNEQWLENEKNKNIKKIETNENILNKTLEEIKIEMNDIGRKYGLQIFEIKNNFNERMSNEMKIIQQRQENMTYEITKTRDMLGNKIDNVGSQMNQMQQIVLCAINDSGKERKQISDKIEEQLNRENESIYEQV